MNIHSFKTDKSIYEILIIEKVGYNKLKKTKLVQSTCKHWYSWASLISVSSLFQSRIAYGKNTIMWCFVFEDFFVLCVCEMTVFNKDLLTI